MDVHNSKDLSDEGKKILSLLNRAYRKKSILSQEKWTYNMIPQFKSVKSDLKILGASKFGSSAL